MGPSETDVAREPPARSPGRAGASSDPLDGSVEAKLGSTAKARAANDALRALARAARAYTVYDAHNAAIRGFIEEMLKTLDAFSVAHGDLAIEVLPFELAMDGEPVYVEKDRERSLATRLYRDGVRELTIVADIHWRQLVGLLEVLSIRYVGLRQDEDDLVTLVEKAGLSHVRVRALDGVVSLADEDEEDEDDELPTEFDFPLPAPTAKQEIAYSEPSEAELALLQDEVRPAHTTPLVVEVMRRVLPRWKEPPVEADAPPADRRGVLDAARDVRDFLVSEGDLVTLVELDRLFVAWAEEHPEELEGVSGWRAEIAARAFLDSVIGLTRDPTARSSLGALLASTPGDALPALLDMLAEPRPDHEEQALIMCLEGLARKRGEEIAARCRASGGAYAALLLRVLSTSSPEHAREVLAKLVRGGDPEVQMEFLALLERIPRGADVRAYLALLLGATEQEVRRRAVAVIVSLEERGAVGVLVSSAERRAKDKASQEELDELGVAVVRLDPARALEAFTRWCAAPGFIKRVLRVKRPLVHAAIAGLTVCPRAAAKTMLQKMEEDADDKVRRAAKSALDERVRAFGADEPPDPEEPDAEESPRWSPSVLPPPELDAPPPRARGPRSEAPPPSSSSVADNIPESLRPVPSAEGASSTPSPRSSRGALAAVSTSDEARADVRPSKPASKRARLDGSYSDSEQKVEIVEAAVPESKRQRAAGTYRKQPGKVERVEVVWPAGTKKRPVGSYSEVSEKVEVAGARPSAPKADGKRGDKQRGASIPPRRSKPTKRGR